MGEGLMKMSDMLKILVFAGPNGSGKSTITDAYDIDGMYINADEIKKVKSCSDLDAANEAEQLREDCLKSGRSFTFETVLSTRRNLDFLIRAKSAGFYISCVVVLTIDPEINVLRVKSRVLDGGHDVPNDKIRSRYTKSLANIAELVSLCNQCRIFDNTNVPEIIYYKDEHEACLSENAYWSQEQIGQLLANVI
jgi:predicted ABC-type ATPase